MKIGIAGPVALELLNLNLKGQDLPETWSFPIISYLINGLVKRGHQVVIYTTSTAISQPFVFEDTNITVCIARNEPHPGRDFFKSERKDLVDLMKRHPVDIINAHWSYEYAWAALDTNIPTVVTLRDHAKTVLRYHFHPYRMMRWIMNYIVLKKAKYLTTNSNYLWQLLPAKQRKKAIVISNFYAKELDVHFSISSLKENYIISVNNGLSKRKNVENGIRAFSLIRKRFPSLKYYLVGGDMEPGGPAYTFANKTNLSEGLVFIGPKPFREVIEYIKSAKLLLHTSREESFGNVILEAMVVGTLVTGGSNSGNVPYLLDYGKAGLLCNVDSPQDIADTVIHLLSSELKADELRTTAHRYAVQNFSEDAIIEKYLSYYNKVLNEK